jgi:hypothetical protein
MKRREFITLLGGAIFARLVPLRASALLIGNDAFFTARSE